MDQTKGLPAHVAIIMDGNGRWAKKKHLPRLAGHNAGMQAMTEIVRKASHMGLQYLTVYAFSTENWKRSQEEVSGIFGLLIKYVDKELQELCRENVRVRVLGDYQEIPAGALASLEKTLARTQENTGLQFNIALNYGSRREIVRAVNRAVQALQTGEAQEAGDGASGDGTVGAGAADAGKGGAPLVLTEALISRYLYTGEENGNVPDPDLVIRTSGEERLSNFLLWQSAYSELAFTDTLWPDFTPAEFETMVMEFGGRERRFGGRNEE